MYSVRIQTDVSSMTKGMIPMMSAQEIREALKNHVVEVTFRYDYRPSREPERATYQQIEFSERAWQAVLRIATKRRKMSKQLEEKQNAIKRQSRLDEQGMRVRVLTMEAALNLQNAGYELQVSKVTRSGQ